MTREDLVVFLTKEGYNTKALKILTYDELKRIAILTIAIDWGVINVPKL